MLESGEKEGDLREKMEKKEKEGQRMRR